MTPCSRCHERNATREDLCKRCAAEAREDARHAKRLSQLTPAIPCNVCGESVSFVSTDGFPRPAVDPTNGRRHRHVRRERPGHATHA